jgi:hypothetical protein
LAQLTQLTQLTQAPPQSLADTRWGPPSRWAADLQRNNNNNITWKNTQQLVIIDKNNSTKKFKNRTHRHRHSIVAAPSHNTLQMKTKARDKIYKNRKKRGKKK